MYMLQMILMLVVATAILVVNRTGIEKDWNIAWLGVSLRDRAESIPVFYFRIQDFFPFR